MRKVKLYGELAKKFGREFMLEVESVAEAIRALSANFPGFEKELMTSHLRGVEYVVRADKRDVSEIELNNSLAPQETIRVAPIAVGRKNGGVFQTIVGAILVVVGLVLTAYGQAWGKYLIQAGIALVAGGIIQMLVPVPKTDGPSERPENKPSSYFNGAVNTLAQGHPVPLGYGKLIVGSAVISAGLTVEEA
jgi:predicted phage tail protein